MFQVLLKKLYIGEELGEAVSSFRLHHQGIPNNITYNPKIAPSKELIERLKKLGHTFLEKTSISVVQAIYKKGDVISAVSDPRKYGKPDGY